MRKRRPIYMPYGCLYLNNSGDRWITNDMDFCLVLPDGTMKPRRADYYYAFGNFGGIAYRYRGKRYVALPDSQGRILGLLVVVHKETANA